MTDDLRTQVAKAILVEAHPGMSLQWDSINKSEQTYYLKQADAAIRVMTRMKNGGKGSM